VRVVAVLTLLAASLAQLPHASAVGTCGPSNAHTLCVSVPDGPLSGEVPVTLTNVTNKGVVIATWIPNGGSATELIVKAGPSPTTNTYGFVWPTQKYLDASGTLRVQHGTTGSTPVEIGVTLANGNATDFQHTPNDWASYLPGPWTGEQDPTIYAVGDGASDEKASDAVAGALAALDPPLFLYLGDVYESGTFTENRSHYGQSSMDVPGAGTLWGSFADRTQTTNGNHEAPHPVDWRDYWHGRPLSTKFTFGGVLFLDMNSSKSMGTSSAQYKFVQTAITDPAAPPCVVAYWHHPIATGNGTVRESLRAVWQLMARNGVDLVLTAHSHLMVEYRPLDDAFQAGTEGAHMVQLVSGAGGHAMTSDTGYPPGSSIAWSKGKVPGFVGLTLDGAAAGGTATRLSWAFQDTLGTTLRTGSVGCGNRPPTVDAGADQQVTLPAAATLAGSVTDDGQPDPPGTTTVGWSQVSGPGTATFGDPSSASTTASFDLPGTYVLRLQADDGAEQRSDDVTVTVDAEGTVVLDIPIATSRDDAEESATGTMSVTGTDLELVTDANDQLVGLRYLVPIPAGATVEEAWVQFEVDEATSGPIALTIQGQAADVAVTFSSGSGRISIRARTTQSVSWIPPAWPSTQVHGPDQRTPDLTPVLSEILARPGWSSGNALVLIITGTGRRTAEAFDGTYAPVLHVKYAP
jgi:hypothetical protein